MNSRTVIERVRHTWVGREVSKQFVTRFVILCHARTGSSLLATELDRRCARVRMRGEVFRSDVRPEGETARDVAERALLLHGARPGTVVGCKVQYGQVSRDELSELLGIHGIKVIHLRRRNPLRIYVSREIARAHDWWVQREVDSTFGLDERLVDVDVGDLLMFLDGYHLAQQRVSEMLRGSDSRDVWYEDLASDLDGTLDDVARFLGAGTPAPMGTTVLRRQNPEPLRQLIRNYDEVAGALTGTRWQWFLDADDLPVVGRRRSFLTNGSNSWPTPEQELLLSAAIGSPEGAHDAFAQWRSTHDIHDLDAGSRRLLPLVYRNLRRGGLASSIEPELRLHYLETSSRNQKLLQTLEEVVECLDRAGVPTIALKGAALTMVHYQDRGVRPMHDLDVMVRKTDVEAAVAALRRDGWQVVTIDRQKHIGRLLELHHALTLRRTGEELDLHWHAFAEVASDGLDADFWAASRTVALGDHCVQVLAPSDQLLHVIVHGIRFNRVPSFRWIPDAKVIVTSSEGDIDWQRLVRLGERHRVVAQLAAAGDYLRDRFPDIIPPAVVADLRSLPVSDRERRELEYTTQAHPVLRSLGTWWYRYRRRQPDQPLLRAAAGFARTLPAQPGVEEVRQSALQALHLHWRRGEGTWRTDITRFIILAHARTGSNLLTYELNRRCPRTVVDSEVFARDNRPVDATARDIADRVFRWRDGYTVVGCKVLYQQLNSSELSDVLRIDGMKVVHLQRRKWLRVFVSQEIARRHGWLLRAGAPAPTADERAVAVSIDRMFRYFRYYERQHHIAVRSLRNSDVLDVWYEELNGDFDATLETVTRFLGAGKPVPTATPVLQRQNPEPLRVLIRNYDDVVAALGGTRWASFLDDAEHA